MHFSNNPRSGTTTTSIGQDGRVVIPDVYLTKGLPVYAFIFLHNSEDDGETEYVITIPVNARPQPTDEEPTPEQQSEINQIIAALNDVVERSETAADSAEASATASAASAEQSAASATEAAESADRAEQAAANAGYMFFYIDENGDLIYQRTPNVDVDFYLSDGDLYVGATA